MIKKLIVLSFLVLFYCSKKEAKTKYSDEMTEQDWKYLYINACSKVSFDNKKVYTFKEVRENVVICNPEKNESGVHIHMNTTFVSPKEEFNEAVPEN